MRTNSIVAALAASVCVIAIVTPAQAQQLKFDIPPSTLKAALDAYGRQSGQPIIYRSEEVRNVQSPGFRGTSSSETALEAILVDTGFRSRLGPANSVAIVKARPVAAGSEPADDVADIVVTGSNIRGVNPTSPVRTISREDISRSGYSSVGDLVRSLPENFSGGQNPGVIGAFSGNIQNTNPSNASTVNLRGLGTDATLVLVNGNRLSGDSLFQGSDISVIPLSVIDRIDVVTDGASAVYGSDAVAGVVNFVLKKNFNGLETNAQLGTTTQGGGFEQTYSGLAGGTAGRWYGLISAEWSKNDSVSAGQRAFTAQATPVTTLWAPQERTSLFGRTGAEFGRLRLSVDGMYSRRESNSASQTSATASLYTYKLATKAYSVAAAAELDLGADWSAKLNGVASGSRNDTETTVFTPAAYSHSGYKNWTRYAELTLNGTVATTPAGPIKIAIGGGYRSEGFNNNLPTNSSFYSVGRDVEYGYAELFAPLVAPSNTRTGLNELELSASGRIENYSDFGRTANPKVGLRYVPLPGLTLRGTWGQSFKAPSFTQLYQSSYLYLWSPATVGSSKAGAVLMTYGGNPSLGPESSNSWTVGADIKPVLMSGFKLSLTYFNIDYKDRVVQPIPSFGTALSNPLYAPFVEGAPSAARQAALIAAANFFYNFSGAAYNSSNVIALINDNYQNALTQSIHGIDASLSQSFIVGSNRIELLGNLSWLTLKQKTSPIATNAELTGTIFDPPRFKARSSVTWTRGSLTSTATVNYIGASRDTGTTPNERIAPWTTLDTVLSYKLPFESGAGANTQITLSVINLLDSDPPYTVSPTTYAGLHFDSTNGNVLGRIIRFGIQKKW